MNWYKKSNNKQEPLKFFKDVPKIKPQKIQETEEYKKLEERTPSVLIKLIQNCSGEKEIMRTLRIYRFNAKKINNQIYVHLKNDTYIIENFEKPIIKVLQKQNNH